MYHSFDSISMADRRRRHSSYKIAKRRAEAITFLSNISLSGKVEKKHRKNGEGSKQNVTVVDDDTKDDVGFKVRPNVNIANVRDSTTTPSRVSIPNVLTLETPQGKSVRQRNSASATLTNVSTLSFLHTETGVHETPTSSTSSKLRRSLSGPRTRRTSGGHTPPSSPTKG